MKKMIVKIDTSKKDAERVMKEILKKVPQKERVDIFIKQDEEAIAEECRAYNICCDEKEIPETKCVFSVTRYYFYKKIFKTKGGWYKTYLIPRKTNYR